MGYLRARLIQAFVTIYSIITIGFLFIRMIPGGPERYLIGQIQQNPREYGLPPNPTMADINEVLQNQMNTPPDEPLYIQYIDYVAGAFQGDMGRSLVYDPGADVLVLIAEAAPWTIFYTSAAMVYGILSGIIIGSLMAYYEGSKFDVGTTVTILLTRAIPYYVVGLLLLFFLGYNLSWFPTGGRFNSSATAGFNYPFIAGVFNHAALPILSLMLTQIGGSALGLRANEIRLLGSDYIRVARLRGLSTYTISTRYLARNSILPMYTGLVIGFGGLLGGSVILEEIFSYRGMGLLMFNATEARDYPLITAQLVIYTILFVIGTLIADLTYSLIDPRADLKGMED